jgi:hypothetical protein
MKLVSSPHVILLAKISRVFLSLSEKKGAISPLGYFDPLGFCKDRGLVGVKRFREAEILHGR